MINVVLCALLTLQLSIDNFTRSLGGIGVQRLVHRALPLLQSTERKRLPQRRFRSTIRSQQFGIPAGREDELLPAPEPEPEPEAEPVPLPELPEPDMPEDAEPVVLPDDDPLAWFLLRAVLVLTSQHWFEADVAPDPEPEPEPVPCALAKVASPKTAPPSAAARTLFFMDVSSFVHRPIAGRLQSRLLSYVPLSQRAVLIFLRALSRGSRQLSFRAEER